MAADEFEKMEAYLRNLEALRHYPRVKRERDSLAVEVPRLKEKVAELESEVSAKNELCSQLNKSEAEIKELAGKLEEAAKELSSLRNFKVKLPEGNGLILEEMKTQFLQKEEEEIERRAQELFQELERNIRSQMPSLIHERLVEVLRHPNWPPEVKRLIHSRARKRADRILRDRDKWPEWFQAYYLDQVTQSVSLRLDSEFQRGVEQEAERRLEVMKAGQWRAYTAAKARALSAGLKDAIKELRGTWWFTCNKCTGRLAIDIGPSEIGALLRGETIDIACTTCSDPAPFPFILSTVPHKVGSLTLEGLLQLYMGKAPTTG